MQKFMQVKEYLLELSFLALLVRIICVGAGIGEALAVISLVVSMAYSKWLAKNKVEQFQELKEEMQTMYAKFGSEIELMQNRMQSLTFEKSITKRQVSEEKPTTGPAKRIF